MITMSDIPTTSSTGERADLLEKLAQARFFLRFTTQNLDDARAALSPTASRLCLGGLIKHVASVEERWADFILRGAEAMAFDADSVDDHAGTFEMLPGETLAGLLERYAEVARRTDEIVAGLPDLDVSHALPEAPWFPAGARWSARRVVLHLIAETAQHAGHADILRETLDGSKSMG
jgi:hypothetical protein